MAKHPDKKLLAVMGAGHVKDVKKLLNRMDAMPRVSYSFSFSAG